jgi:hypothetical protein
MEKSEELRPTGLNHTDGPRCWRTKEWGEKPVKFEGGFLTLHEANEGFHRAFSKCQLAYGADGKKYRTNKPRMMPSDNGFKRNLYKKMEEKECG